MSDYYSPEIKKMIVDQIKKYPTLYGSDIHVLDAMFDNSGYDWKNGRLVNTVKYVGKRDKSSGTINLARAEHICKYGRQRHFVAFSEYDNYNKLSRIPNDVAEDWVQAINYFCHEVNHYTMTDYKLQLLAYCCKSYNGLSNPHCYVWYDRKLQEFLSMRKFANQFVKDHDAAGWSADSLHDPEKQKALSKEMGEMIAGILDEAEGFIPKAYKAD